MAMLNCTIEEYHSHPALSSSKVKVYSEEGSETFHRMFNLGTIPRPKSSAFDVGNGFECLLFEGQAAFDQRYACKPPGMSFANKDGREWRDSVKETHTILSQDGIPDLATVFDDMLAAIKANPFVTKLLAKGRAQVTVRRSLDALGVEAQTRPDWLNTEKCEGITEGAYTVNLKTCADLNLYARQCVQHGYPHQSALEQFLLAKEGITTEHLQLVVEKKLAPRCKVLRIRETILAPAWEITKKNIESISARYKSGVWTEIQEKIEDVDISIWDEKRLAAQVEDL